MGESYTKYRYHKKRYPQLYGWEKLCADVPIQGGWYSRTFRDKIVGEKQPDWRLLISRKENACTPLVGERYSYTWKPWFLDGTTQINETNPPTPCQDITSARWSYGVPPPYPLHYTSTSKFYALSESQANNIALEVLAKKIRKKQTTFQGGVFLGELREAASMLRSPMKSLRGGIRQYLEHLKKGARKTRRLPPKTKRRVLSDTWLEHSFGWLPFLSDIDSITQAVAESAVRTDEGKQIVTAVGQSEEIIPEAKSLTTGGTPPYAIVKFDEHQLVLVKYQAMIRPGSFRLHNMQRVGFDPSNWLPTVWELVPWSFLVDYFTNVGEIVSSASLARNSISWINKTVVKSIDYHSSRTEVQWHSDLDVVRTRAIGSAIMRNRRVTRTRSFSGTLIPDFQASIPDFGMKWANMAALGVASKRTSRLIR